MTATTVTRSRPVIRIVIPKLRRSKRTKDESKIRAVAQVINLKAKIWLSKRSKFTKYVAFFGTIVTGSFAIAYVMYTAAWWCIGIPLAVYGYPVAAQVMTELVSLVFSIAGALLFVEAIDPWFNF